MALNRESLDPALQLYGTQEAAEILRITQRRIWSLIKEGSLRASRPRGRWLISAADLQEYLDRASNVPRQKAPEAAALAGDTAAAAETAGETATD